MAVGLTSQQGIGLIIAGVFVVAFIGAMAYIAQGRRPSRDRPDIPPAMQPGPSDADLEKPRLEKLQGFGVAFVLFFVIWIPLVWLLEPSENLHQERSLKTDSIARGAQDVQLFSETNQGGIGCVRCHGDNPPLGGGLNLNNGQLVDVPNLRIVCGSTHSGGVYSIVHNVNDLKNIIMQGIPNTDMPSWSVRFQGSLDDYQVQDIVDYILSIQQVPFKYNVCINIKAPDYQTPVVPAQ